MKFCWRKNTADETEETKGDKPPVDRKSLKYWAVQVRQVLVLVVIFCALRSTIADWNDVPSASMNPTILIGDRIFVNRLAYDLKVPFTTWHIAEWGGPARGDIVVFNSPENGIKLVKRVVGLPGDTIEMRQDILFINDQRLTYSKLGAEIAKNFPDWPAEHLANENLDGSDHPVMMTPAVRAMRTFGPLVVPDGHYFMLGDNRDCSKDSRFIGPIERKLILGKASHVALSVDKENYYMPRWSRMWLAIP